MALQPGQLDDLLHELGEPVALGEHPPGEALHGLGVVGRVGDGLGEQADRADRGLELVADVGHEVAAYGLHAALAGAVLDERQHQPGSERRHPRGQRAGEPAVERGQVDVALADLPVASHLRDEVEQLGQQDGVAAHQPEGVRRRRGLEDVVGLVDHHGAGAQDAQDGRDARLDDGRLRLGRRVALPVADVPREDRAARHDGPDERRQGSLRRRIHAHIVRTADVGPDRMDGRHGVFTPRSSSTHICSLRLPTVPDMREAFHDQLDGIFADLSDICGQVEIAVREATKALLSGDVHTADQVISNDKAIDAARERVDDTAFALLSLQQPVAGDLRMIVSALRMVSELERMGDLSVHVAKIARLRVPSVAVPDELRPTMEQMARTAEDMVRRVRDIIVDRDVEAAIELGRDDEVMDQLRRRSFTELLSTDWQHGVEAAVDIALLGRYYERIADHAVSVANRVVFVVTGDLPPRD